MAEITGINAQTTIDVTLDITFDSGYSALQVWASHKVREADVPKVGYYAFVKEVTNGATVNATFEELGTRNSRQVWVRVLGVRLDGSIESLNDPLVTPFRVVRINNVDHDTGIISGTTYPAVAQVPFGFDAHSVTVENTGGQAGFISFDGVVDIALAADEIKIYSSQGVRGSVAGRRIFVRSASTATTFNVRAVRPDSEYL